MDQLIGQIDDADLARLNQALLVFLGPATALKTAMKGP